MSVESQVRSYILENLMFSGNPADLASDESLLDRGVIDSTGVLEIVLFLETTFGVKIKDSEMLPENFDSVDGIVRFVGRLRGGSGS